MARRILTEFVMDKIAAVDKPCQEHATVTIMKRDFSAKDRKEDAKSGAAMPGGGFPIENTNDLHNAVRAIGRAKNPAAAKAHIRQRAKALGVDDPFGKSFSSDGAAMNAFKKLAMLRTNVLKAKANEMLESQEDCGGGKMPRRGPVKRNSQPMTKAWSDAAREAARASRLKSGQKVMATHPDTGKLQTATYVGAGTDPGKSPHIVDFGNDYRGVRTVTPITKAVDLEGLSGKKKKLKGGGPMPK